MGCEESFITVTLIWHDYLVLSLNIYIHKTFTATGLMGHLLVKRRKPKAAPHRLSKASQRKCATTNRLRRLSPSLLVKL